MLEAVLNNATILEKFFFFPQKLEQRLALASCGERLEREIRKTKVENGIFKEGRGRG